MKWMVRMKHFRYLRYVLVHKWYVFWCCWSSGIPWRGLVHDLSKFSWSEWFAYARYFYGGDKSAEAKSAFDTAWLHHIHANPHHWEHWVIPGHGDGYLLVRMPRCRVLEMVADWNAMSLARGTSALGWYNDNCDNMLLHPETRAEVVELLRARWEQAKAAAGVTNNK